MFKKFSKKGQRLFALLLAVAMLFSVMPMNAIAVTTNSDGYIEVRTIQDLYNVRLDLTANYILMNDIDLTEATANGGEWDFGGRGWNPIGSEDIYSNSAFTGIFNGNGHAIIGMRIDFSGSMPSGVASSKYVGLFAKVTGAVYNLEMRDVNITNTANSMEYVGAITGFNEGTISNCDVSGKIDALYAGTRVGGISGHNKGTISCCYNTADVLGNDLAGGITGRNYGTIENCYNTGSVESDYSGSSAYAGGIAAENGNSSDKGVGKIISSYNLGKVKQYSSTRAYAIAYTYYTGSYGSNTNCYYLSETGLSSIGCTVLTDAQMRLESMYSGFDFDNTWVLNTNAVYEYPQLVSNIQDDRDILNSKVATLPNRTTFQKEEELDMTGCTLEFIYTNADTEYVPVTNDMVTGYDKNVVGEQTLTITHNFRTFEITITVDEKPFKEVYTVLDLYNIRYDLNSNYILMNDIDLTEATANGGEWDFGGRGWNPIGSEDIYSNSAFTGIFNGNGHAIIGMRIDFSGSMPSGVASSKYVGLFAKVTGAVYNLEMRDVNITNTANSMEYVGAITGFNEGTISNCDVSGKIDALYAGTRVGGISGHNKGTISCCYNTADVLGNDLAGGITGRNYGTIENCYNTGSVESDYSGSSAYAGGIAAENGNSSDKGVGKIISSYNLGKVKQYSSTRAYAIAYTYYTGSYGSNTNCYYLSGTGLSSIGCTSLAESQMQIQSVFEGYDFNSIWSLDNTANYPYPQLKANSQDIRVISNAKIYSLPVNLIYTKGETLNVSGMVLEFSYANADTEYVSVTNDMVTGFDSSVLGIQTLSVTYHRKTFEFEVTINEKPFSPIYTAKELYDIRNDLTGNYILMNDIDLTEATANGGEWDFGGRGWNPIGSEDIYSNSAFTGIFNGNGHAIIGMRIDFSGSMPSGVASSKYVGLFAKVTGAVYNLEMRDVNITNTANSMEYVGAITGFNEGTISNCDVSGKIDALYAGTRVGGISGHNKGTISCCYNTADVLGNDLAGGITGRNYGTIENCYNTGSVESDYSGSSAYAGGIAAENGNSSDKGVGKIISSYNLGKVKQYSSSRAYAIAYTYYTGTYGSNTNCYYLSGTGLSSIGCTVLTDAQMRLESMYAGFDFNNTWTINAYANHPYPQLKSNIQDLNETVTLIRVIAYPAKMDYLTGDELNMVGGMFEAIYISGKTDVIALSNEYITGYDPNVVGTQTLTVTYGGQTDTFDINVAKRPEATSVTILTEPTQKEFVVGTKLDFAGATVKVEYDNNTNEVLDVTVDMTTGANINHMGTQTVTVTIDGCSDTFEIKVVPASISGITISTLPNKVVYIEGEKLDTTGLAIVANYTNGSEISIASGYTVSGYDANKTGEQTITVDFVGKKATFTVTVVEKVLTNIEIQAKPKKLNYVVGEELDLTGMVVVASYETGELVIIDDYTVSGFDGTAGSKVITVTYKGKSASFTVNVAVIAVEKLTLTKLPVKLAYIENEPLNTEGLIVTATYNDGTVKNVTDYDVVGFSSLPGVHTLYVVFGGQVASFQINVSAKVLSDVRVVLPNKTTYNIGDEFDTTGMQVIACYNNGQEHLVDSYTMTGFDSLSAGAKEIVITYGGFTRSFAVAVVKKVDIETDGAIKIGTLKGRLGETVEVPVTITQNPGLTAFCHTITFDATDLKFVSVTANNGFANGTVVLNDEKVANGEITVLWYQPTDVVESGVAYTLNFEILETATDGVSEITIAFDKNDNGNASGENILFEGVNGSVEVLSYWLGDLDGDRKYTMVDIVQLSQYVSGKQMTLTDKQKKSADVNEDGVIDVHDVTLLSQWLLDADF